jgi:hypothetical protein
MNEIKHSYNDKNMLLKLLQGEGVVLSSPPNNCSDKTTIELELLESIGTRIKKEDVELVEKYNENVVEQYYHILDQFSLKCNKEEIDNIVSDIKIIVESEKKKHNRPRPVELGKDQGFNINESVQYNYTSSYPSGHATESMFLSLYFSDRYPLYKNIFMETANKISNSRLISSNNYPTDNLAGQTLAYILYGKYQEQ